MSMQMEEEALEKLRHFPPEFEQPVSVLVHGGCGAVETVAHSVTEALTSL
jgi:hypothetical protein